MNFNKEKHIASQEKSVIKLVNYFNKKGVKFKPTDGNFENVIFETNDKQVKISHHSFYRYSGIATLNRDKGERDVEIIEVTDEMYLDIFMKPIIETLLLK